MDQRSPKGDDPDPTVDGARLRAVLTDQILAILPTDFRFEGTVNTGGNCTAFQILAPDGREMLITDGDASTPYDLPDYSTDLMFGYSNSDGEPIEAWYLYQTECEPDPAQVSTIIGAWAGGTPLFNV